MFVCVGVNEFRYDIKYPQMYAEQSDPNAVEFNCYQRAHQVRTDSSKGAMSRVWCD